MRKICITGANGFIGQLLCKYLSELDNSVLAIVRDKKFFLNLKNVKYYEVKNFNDKNLWKSLLKNYDCIVHCAGKANLPEKLKDCEKYNSENFINIKDIAEQAAEVGVKRIIYLSSIKIYGEITDINHNQPPKPESFYAISKLETEKALTEISLKFDLEPVIIRLPLVYGYGVKGNLEKLVKLVKSGIPLPLGIVNNKRSMIGIDNLVDLIICCIDNPEASGKTFLASDGEDLSTPELIKLIASSMGRKANLFPLPIFMLKFLGSIFGKREEINRLVGSLRIDNNYTKETLNHTPPLSIEEGIRRMVQRK